MKQTKNALTMLLSAYRSVFRNAYFKGMAAAVMLTAGMTAGAANAADPYQVWTDYGWSQSATDYLDNSAKTVAGKGIFNADVETTLSEGKLVVGAEDLGAQVGSITGSAIGAEIKGSTTGTLAADSNQVYVTSGGAVTGAVIGGKAINATGLAQASHNKVTIDKALKGDLGSGADKYINGGRAQGLTGAIASFNEVTLTGSVHMTDASNPNYGQLQPISDSIYGGTALSQDATTSGSFLAEGNKVTIDYASSAKDGLMIVGGSAEAIGNGKVTSVSAGGNTVAVSHSYLGSGAAIYANLANAVGGATLAAVSGNADETSLLISAVSTDDTKTIDAYAGRAAIKDGNAEAKDLSLHYSDTISSGDKVAASAEIIVDTGSNLSLSATNNKVVLSDSNSEDAVTTTVNGNVMGAQVSTSGSAAGKDFSGSTITANNNTVDVSAGTTVNGSVYGAWIGQTNGSGASVSADGNVVNFNGTLAGTSHDKFIIGAFSNGEATLTNNQVNINGNVSNAVIAAADADGTGHATLQTVFSDNSVVIDADAEVTDSYIAVALSDEAAESALNNDVTVKGKLTNSSLMGGQGADSLVSLEAGSNYKVTTGTQFIASDNTSIAGTVEVAAGAALQLAGYFAENKTDYDLGTQNSGLTTVAAGAELKLGGELQVYNNTKIDDAATLVATVAGSKINITGQNVTVPAENAVGSVGTLSLSVNKLHEYIEPATTQDPQNPDVAGTVNLLNKGVLELTDSSTVVINKDVQSSVDNAGKVNIDASATDYAIIKGHDVAITGDLSDTFGIGSGDLLTVEGDIVTLGDSNYLDTASSNQDKWSSLGLKQVTVHDTLKLAANGAQTFKTGSTNIYLSRDAAGQGTIEDDLLLDGVADSSATDATGSLIVGRGAFVANGDVTLSGGGLILGQSTSGDLAYEQDKETASLSFAGSTLHITQGTQEAITLGYDAAYNKTVLDLSDGNLDVAKDINGIAGVRIFTNGTLVLNSTDAKEFFNQSGANGMHIYLMNQNSSGKYDNATFKVEGDLADIEFTDFVNNQGSANAGEVNFSGVADGTFEVTGSLGLVTGKAAESSSVTGTQGVALDFGDGIIQADSVTLTNRYSYYGTGDVVTSADKVEFKNGTINTNNFGSTVDGQTVVIGAQNGAAEVNLGLAETGNSGALLSSVEVQGTGAVNFAAGDWNLGGNDITVSAGEVNIAAGATLTSGDALVVKGGVVALAGTNDEGETVASSAEFNQLQTAGTGTVTIAKDTILTINGIAPTEENKDYYGVQTVDHSLKVSGSLAFGEQAAAGVFNVEGSINDNYGVIDTVRGSQVSFAFADTVDFTAQKAEDFKTALFGDVDMLGTVDVGSASFSELDKVITEDGTISWTDYHPYAGFYSNLLNDTMRSTTLTVTDAENTNGVEFTGGRIQLTGTADAVNIADNTSLTGINGQYVIGADGNDADLNVAADVPVVLTNNSSVLGHIADTDLDTGASLTLKGSGQFQIGSVTGTGEVDVDAATAFTGNIEANELTITKSLTYTGDAVNTGAIDVDNLFVDGGKLNAKDVTVASGEFYGQVNVENLTVTSELDIEEGATTTVSKIMTVENGASVWVGFDGDDAAGTNSAPGYLEVNELKLEGDLYIDPAYDAGTAFVAVGKFDGTTGNDTAEGDIEAFDGGVQSGNILVGQNSVMGVGIGLANLQSAVERYQTNGNLSNAEGSYGAILYLNKQIEIGDGNGIVLQATKAADENQDGLADANKRPVVGTSGPGVVYENGDKVLAGYYDVQDNTLIMDAN